MAMVEIAKQTMVGQQSANVVATRIRSELPHQQGFSRQFCRRVGKIVRDVASACRLRVMRLGQEFLRHGKQRF